MGIKVDVTKMSKEVCFGAMAYTTMEYLREHGPLSRETITAQIVKEFPDLGDGAMLAVFDALVDSRLIAFTPSAGVYRMSQAGKLAFAIAKAVGKAVGHGTEPEEPSETLQ